MRSLTGCFLCAVMVSGASAEDRWKYEEAIDAISAKNTRTLVIVGDDDKSVLGLVVTDKQNPVLTVLPKSTIFPDETDVERLTMKVQITFRSTNMEKPASAYWRMKWMDYGEASISMSKRNCTKLFGGDSIAVQFDTAGRRYSFPTKGDGYAGVQAAVAKALEIAKEQEPAK